MRFSRKVTKYILKSKLKIPKNSPPLDLKKSKMVSSNHHIHIHTHAPRFSTLLRHRILMPPLALRHIAPRILGCHMPLRGLGGWINLLSFVLDSRVFT